MPEATYTVRGMTCEHCVRSVTEEVEAIDSVLDVSVDLATGRLDIRSNKEVDVDTVRAAVDEAGYELEP